MNMFLKKEEKERERKRRRVSRTNVCTLFWKKK